MGVTHVSNSYELLKAQSRAGPGQGPPAYLYNLELRSSFAKAVDVVAMALVQSGICSTIGICCRNQWDRNSDGQEGARVRAGRPACLSTEHSGVLKDGWMAHSSRQTDARTAARLLVLASVLHGTPYHHHAPNTTSPPRCTATSEPRLLGRVETAGSLVSPWATLSTLNGQLGPTPPFSPVAKSSPRTYKRGAHLRSEYLLTRSLALVCIVAFQRSPSCQSPSSAPTLAAATMACL